jgi:hypothetical protein
MLARLGDVLYWAGCLIAAAFIGLELHARNPSDWLFVISFSVVMWLLGRAARYVLAGR